MVVAVNHVAVHWPDKKTQTLVLNKYDSFGLWLFGVNSAFQEVWFLAQSFC